MKPYAVVRLRGRNDGDERRQDKKHRRNATSKQIKEVLTDEEN